MKLNNLNTGVLVAEKYIATHPTVAILQLIKTRYIKDRYVFVEGNTMREILRFFGATNEDLLKLEYSGNHLSSDPTLPFRKSRNGRFFIDFTDKTVKRLEFQPFVLSKEEDFVRDDSGSLRYFRGIQDEIQQNTAFQGLMKFKAYVIEGVDVTHRKNLHLDYNKWVSTVFQLRTITTPSLMGEPAKEGVHSDGVEHTMTTYTYSENMTPNSAVSQLHSQEQKTGIAWDEVDEMFVVDEFQHKHFLDTLLIVDSELKHTVSPVKPLDDEKNALRDMIIFFTRRPKVKEHSTFAYDSLSLHPEIPLEFSISK